MDEENSKGRWMVWKLPPLNALRAFECAGRLGSFTLAADELHVTPGAISKQIRNLEAFLEAERFYRDAREVRLTEVGHRYHAQASKSFSVLHDATEQILHRIRKRPLRIWSSMTFSMRWLVPRLAPFLARNKGLDVIVTTSLRPVDFNQVDVDVAIRYGTGNWPGLNSHLLIRTELLPVCSPALVKTSPIRSIDDLANHTLLHSTVRQDDWKKWLTTIGYHSTDPTRGLQFESSMLAYQAAIEGLGVAMGQKVFVEEDIAAGRLVAPLSQTVESEGGFYLIYPASTADKSDLVLFRDWIMDQAAKADG